MFKLWLWCSTMHTGGESRRANYTKHTMHTTLHTAHCAAHCTATLLNSIASTTKSMQSCTQCFTLSEQHIVRTLRIVHCTIYFTTQWNTLQTRHCTLHTARCTLHTGWVASSALSCESTPSSLAARACMQSQTCWLWSYCKMKDVSFKLEMEQDCNTFQIWVARIKLINSSKTFWIMMDILIRPSWKDSIV